MSLRKRPLFRQSVLAWACSLALISAVAGMASSAHAQSANDGVAPTWQQLTPAQRKVLAPLEGQWSSIGPDRKRKWLDLAGRHPNMSPEEQQRMNERMSQWAQLSPQERGQVRSNFQEIRQLPASERQARWEAYQALPEERRKELAAQAGSSSEEPRNKLRGRRGQDDDAPMPKSNIVDDPEATNGGKPGATTTLVSRQANPPAHQQAGLPKVAATPGFVDSRTLLPKRGPQGAATGGPAGKADKPDNGNKDNKR